MQAAKIDLPADAPSADLSLAINTEKLLSNGRDVFDIEIQELQTLRDRLGPSFAQAVASMRNCVERGKKIVLLGVGKSGHVGEKIAATLTSTGAPAVVLNALNALHGDLGVVADGDLVLALSYSGETDELLQILPPLKRLTPDLIAITSNPESTLGRAATLVLEVRVSREACPMNLAPTASTTAMLVLGDALSMALLRDRGFSETDFARYHPGGKIGRTLLLKVGDVMRDLQHTAICKPETQVVEALAEMSLKRTGAVLVVDETQKLLGIFTHGDFARVYQSEPGAGSHALSQHMTTSPSTIRAESLAVEILTTLAARRIDDLPVVDEEGRVLGLIDSQDLARHRLL